MCAYARTRWSLDALEAEYGESRAVGRLFVERWIHHAQRAKHLVRRNMMKAALGACGPRLTGGLQQCEGSHHVRLDKCRRPGDGSVHVALGREVHDGVDGVRSKDRAYEVSIANVAMNKDVPVVAENAQQVLLGPGIGQQVQRDDLRRQVGRDDRANEGGTDKARAASHQNALRNMLTHAESDSCSWPVFGLPRNRIRTFPRRSSDRGRCRTPAACAQCTRCSPR